MAQRRNIKVDGVACPWPSKRFFSDHAEFLFVDEKDLRDAANREGTPLRCTEDLLVISLSAAETLRELVLGSSLRQSRLLLARAGEKSRSHRRS